MLYTSRVYWCIIPFQKFCCYSKNDIGFQDSRRHIFTYSRVLKMNCSNPKSVELSFSRLQKRVRPLLVSLLIIGGVSCDDSSSKTTSGVSGTTGFTEQAALIANVANLMDTGFTNLATSTEALKTSIGSYCATVTGGSAGGATERTAVQTAFKTAMNDVQHALLYGVGPALNQEKGTKVLYSWPSTSTCRIDHKQADNDATIPVDTTIRGMDALEYLLFIEPAANHSCPASDTDADLVIFNALAANAKQRRRCDYMINVIADVVVTSTTLKKAWNASAPDNYVATMTSASNTTATLNKVTDAMYYFASIVKDNKLDQPMGGTRTNTSPSCGAGKPCAVDVESPHAKISLDNLKANTLAFQKLFFGGDPANKATNVGFDDWLEAVDGNRTVADKMDADLVALLARIDGLKTSNGTLFSAVTNNITAVNALFDTPLQGVTRSLRDTIIPDLGLKLPQASGSDTD